MNTMDVRNLCVKKQWYTRGTNEEYEKMFEMVRNKADLMDIASDIYHHSTKENCSCIGAAYKELEQLILATKEQNETERQEEIKSPAHQKKKEKNLER